MPTEASVPVTKILASNPIVRLARIQDLDGEYIEQADLSSIAYVVYDLDNSSASVSSGSFTISTTIFDELQTEDIWVEDTIGYNFKATVPAACFPLASRRYRLVVTFNTAAGSSLNDVSDYHTISVTGA